MHSRWTKMSNCLIWIVNFIGGVAQSSMDEKACQSPSQQLNSLIAKKTTLNVHFAVWFLQNGLSIKWCVTRRMSAGYSLALHATSSLQRHRESTSLNSYKDCKFNVSREVTRVLSTTFFFLKIGPVGLLYVSQREMAAIAPHDKNVHIVGSDDATTCIIVVVRHSGSLLARHEPLLVILKQQTSNRFRSSCFSSFGRKWNRWSCHSDGEKQMKIEFKTCFN